jgi:hypothetical protein
VKTPYSLPHPKTSGRIIQEREGVVLILALALFGYSVPYALAEAQGRVGYLLGGLA